MKNLIYCLLLSILSTSLNANAPSAVTNTSTADYIYTIHIGAFVRIKDTDFLKIRRFGFMYAENYDQRLKRIYMGDYETEAAAMETLKKIKVNGYPDAYITKRSLTKGKEVAVIQIATAQIGDEIRWADYAKAGPIMVQANGKQLKIAVGTYPDVDYARARIGSIRKAGFPDAFVRPVNNALLHRVTKFETGNQVQETDGVVSFKDEKVKKIESTSSDEIPVKLQGSKNDTPDERPKDIPQEFDQLVMKGGADSGVQRPDIREKVKRNSVIELQKALKAEAGYKGGLDGFYGSGTTKGYEKVMAENNELQKYKLLMKHKEQLTKKGTNLILQHYINSLVEDTPKAIRGLETSKDPVAKAYRAYALLQTGGDQGKLDYLMNMAIQNTFVGKELKNKPPFDYTAKYTYPNLKQLILHLRYVQSAAEEDLAFPCWLFERHPEEAAAAFKGGDQDFVIEDCGTLMEWEELALLKAIASDLNPGIETDAETLEKYASQRARLFLLPSALSEEESKLTEAWHASLWKGLDAWEKTDPLHRKFVTPFRVAYFQSMVILEDYFMDKNLNPAEARALSINILKTIVAPDVRSYLR